jgi:hypothetical protein
LAATGGGSAAALLPTSIGLTMKAAMKAKPTMLATILNLTSSSSLTR